MEIKINIPDGIVTEEILKNVGATADAIGHGMKIMFYTQLMEGFEDVKVIGLIMKDLGESMQEVSKFT